MNVRFNIKIISFLKNKNIIVRFGIKDLERKFQKSEDDIKALQSVGQIIGEVLKQIDDENCKFYLDHFINQSISIF